VIWFQSGSGKVAISDGAHLNTYREDLNYLSSTTAGKEYGRFTINSTKQAFDATRAPHEGFEPPLRIERSDVLGR